MKVKIKKLKPEAVIPKYSIQGDAGLDLTAVSMNFDDKHGFAEYGTGLSMEIPEGYVGLIFPRSSISKKGVYLTNCVGVVDSNYRGEVTLRFKPDSYASIEMLDQSESGFECEVYKVGERVGQLLILPYPSIEFEEAEELTSTSRGTGGYGSTGL